MPTLPPFEQVSVNGCLDTHFLYKKYVLGALSNLCNFALWKDRTQNDDDAMEILRVFIDIYEKIANGVCDVALDTGMIISSIRNSPPEGFIALNGNSVLVSEYEELAGVVPQSWISNGYINLPNMAGRTVVGQGLYEGGFYQDQFNLGVVGGASRHKLTIAEMPTHNHPPPVGSTQMFANQGTQANFTAGTGVKSVSATGNAGGDEYHNNMPPYLPIYWYIKY